MKKPKAWDTMFSINVIEAYDNGEFDLNDNDSIERWDTKYNGGNKPKPSFETKEIIKYYENKKRIN